MRPADGRELDKVDDVIQLAGVFNSLEWRVCPTDVNGRPVGALWQPKGYNVSHEPAPSWISALALADLLKPYAQSLPLSVKDDCASETVPSSLRRLGSKKSSPGGPSVWR